jgi:hypothetical protein
MSHVTYPQVGIVVVVTTVVVVVADMLGLWLW